MFPNILDFLSKDPATPWNSYAVVLNGKLMATNAKMACYISVDTFIDSPEEIEAIEGKVFNSIDINRFLAPDVSKLEFRNTKYIVHYSLEELPDLIEYTGIVGQNREIQLYDELMEDYNLVRNFKKFPDFTTVIPALTDNEIDVAKVQKRNTHFRGVGLAPSMLVSIAKCFQQYHEHNSDFLRLEFFHASKDKDKVDKPSAPILVSPFKSKFPLYKEAAIINPVF